MAGLVNDPATLDATIRKLVDGWNAEKCKSGPNAADHDRSGNHEWTNVDVHEILLGSADNRLDL